MSKDVVATILFIVFVVEVAVLYYLVVTHLEYDPRKPPELPEEGEEKPQS